MLCKTLADLVNLSISTSTVPLHWKRARICPVPKTSGPTQPSDFRPISVTPVLSRITEKIIVHDFLYPALNSPLSTLSFTDQYAFRPSGSTTAALVALLHRVTEALEINQYVVVLPLDFQQGIRYRPSLQSDGEGDSVGLAGQRIQLACQFFSMDTVNARGSMATRQIC